MVKEVLNFSNMTEKYQPDINLEDSEAVTGEVAAEKQPHAQVDGLDTVALLNKTEQHRNKLNKTELINLDNVAPNDLLDNSWQIFDLNDDEYALFLANLKEYPYRHDLPQMVVSAILERGLKEAENFDYKEKRFIYLVEVESALQLRGVFDRRDGQNKLSLIDKTIIAFKELYDKYPKAADSFWDIVIQNGQTINKEIG